VGSEAASGNVKLPESQLPRPARMSAQYCTHESVHLSRSIAVLKLRSEYAQSIQGPRAFYLHGHGLSLFMPSMPALGSDGLKDIFDILSAERDYLQFLLKTRPGADDVYKHRHSLYQVVLRLFPFRSL